MMIKISQSIKMNISHCIVMKMVFLAYMLIIPGAMVFAGHERESLAPPYDYPDVRQAQGLEAFMERHGVKPFSLYHRGEYMTSSRLIFNDPDFGTEVWMVDDSPASEASFTASIWPAWNADASRLMLGGARLWNGSVHRGWFMDQQYSRLKPAKPPGLSRVIWDREDPDIYFVRQNGRLLEYNLATGSERLIAEWEAYPRERVYGLTRDNRYVFLETPNGGVWLPYEPGDPEIAPLPMYDGRPGGPDASGRPLPPRYATDEWMYRGVPRGKAVDVHPEHGPLFLVRPGMLIDRETGETEYVIVPVSGQQSYLDTFLSDRVEWPSGGEWDKYRIHASDDPDEMFRIYRYYPELTHGHESHSPDGEYIAKDTGRMLLTRIRDSMLQEYDYDDETGHYHVHWRKHPRFFVGWKPGWRSGSFTRPRNGNMIFQYFSDLTVQPIFNTMNRKSTHYGGQDFSMLSPDATKVHTSSSMTGRFRNYIAVMARPRPPQAVEWQPVESHIRLSWKPSEYSRETAGYLVYRSTYSGDGYHLVTPEPVTGLQWTDTSVRPGQDYYYVITSIEHSGLQSGYSQEVARAGIGLSPHLQEPLVVYVEAEHSIRDLDTGSHPGLSVGADRKNASDGYYIYRHPESVAGEAELQIPVPAAGKYTLWVRARSETGRFAAWNLRLQQSGNDTPGRQVTTGQRTWTWVRAGHPVYLESGTAILMLSTSDPMAQLDLIVLAVDGDFVPSGPRPEYNRPPETPQMLSVESVGERANKLTWNPSENPLIAFYHVYASRKPLQELSQKYRIASPVLPEHIDWGLQADTRYYYAVTAVDRWRNESGPFYGEITTPMRRLERADHRLLFDRAETTGSFERSRGAGTHGEVYLVAQDPANNSVSWDIEIPHEDTFFIWLRYLQRAPGNRNTVTQSVEVMLNDAPLIRLEGSTDIHVTDELLVPDHPLASRLWTWRWPGGANLEGVHLPAGSHRLTVKNLHPQIRYDLLLLTNEPSYFPEDGKLNAR